MIDRPNDFCPCNSGARFKKCCLVRVEQESPDVAKQDWRLKAVAQLDKPWLSPFTGNLSPRGTAIIHQTSAKLDSKVYSFGVPAAPALFLSLSKKNYTEARHLAQTVASALENDGRILSDPETIFNFFEAMMASVVFALTAIENFINVSVPNDFTHEEVRSDKKCKEIYDKNQIERFFSLEKKLEIAPQFFSEIRSPKGTKLWERYKKLQLLRDRIIHLKSMDLQTENGSTIPDSIWRELIEMPETYALASDMIGHFHGNNPPRWLWKFNLQ